jgi:hypothetical protein
MQVLWEALVECKKPPKLNAARRNGSARPTEYTTNSRITRANVALLLVPAQQIE